MCTSVYRGDLCGYQRFDRFRINIFSTEIPHIKSIGEVYVKNLVSLKH